MLTTQHSLIGQREKQRDT